MSRFHKLSHGIWHCQYHIVWVLKYRFRVLHGSIGRAVEEGIQAICGYAGCDIEIHGTAFSVSCLNCGKSYDRDEIEKRIREGEKDPRSNACSGILKPATISFGQAMPEDKMAKAFSYASECDLCIVLGSSLVVYPAASVPEHAASRGAKLIIINLTPTPLDSRADVVIHDSVSKVLDTMVSEAARY